ncbi:ATP-binding protein [Peterkaempfera bronchialis]|uniref:Tetratricopeptide repeat protein n=1 Tax=Peterkaempfera bronchialis TaxID=2126346 RepID=A0A345SVB6_9ACTN|nr:tetratricopeptide repeat protein [Peterkaempfera bronchialis]AXI77671.1 tetratricopeptide repeat protein [Peterkaempfera bronchialis]
MAPTRSPDQASRPSVSAPSANSAMRELRGDLSPGEFAARVRRAGREIGEHVSCDARYIGRVEAGEIRCPNYAYERVFRHMFPGRSLADLGFAPRGSVRRRVNRPRCEDVPRCEPQPRTDEENDDVHRRTFMAGGPAALVTALGLDEPTYTSPTPPRRVGAQEVDGVEQAVRRIRLLDDRQGADALFESAGQSLRSAYLLLNAGSYSEETERRLQAGAGELAISVGWLAHDSGRLADARSFYAEALATARMAGDPALEAHAFCNSAFLARDAGRPREAVRAAQAAQQAASHVGSYRLLSLLAMREAGGWAVLQERRSCERAMLHGQRLFDRGSCDADPEWMSFFGRAELIGLEAQCWSALGDWDRAVDRARLAMDLQKPHFVRNRALYTAELAHDQLGRGDLAAAAVSGTQALDLLTEVRSARIRSMLAGTAGGLRRHRDVPEVAAFVERYDIAG